MERGEVAKGQGLKYPRSWCVQRIKSRREAWGDLLSTELVLV